MSDKRKHRDCCDPRTCGYCNPDIVVKATLDAAPPVDSPAGKALAKILTRRR